MLVRAKKAAGYKPQGQQAAQPQTATHTFPAPTLGWVLDENLMAPSPGGARILDNFICLPKSIKARGGYTKHATVASAAAVVSLFSYKSGSTEKLFGASATDIYDITSPADPDVVPTAAVSSQTSGYYSTAQFTTAGGDYLYAVNGDDSPQLFDGSTWTAITGASTPAITGVTTSGLSHVWSFANRLFFVEGGTMTAWYLGVDSIGGAANSFSLGGVFKKGGSLLFGAAWSLDAGDGLDDKCVFVSTEGEVAIYEGTNPGSASEWRKVGVYQISKPLGKNGIMQAGGDLIIATEIGIVPISEAIRRDVAALNLGAVSKRIETYWQERARNYATLPWEIIRWPSEGIMIVSQPEATSTGGSLLVANLQSGAWSRFTGMDARCLGYYAGYVYFGAIDGGVYKLQSGGSDAGTAYTSVYLGQHEAMGAQGVTKTVHQMRPVFTSGSPIVPQVSAKVNFSETLSSPPNAAVFSATAGWDISLWDVGLWDADSGLVSVSAEDSRWRGVGVTGYVIAPELQMTFGATTLPDAELAGIDATYSIGAVVA